jgi:hypothetical protein
MSNQYTLRNRVEKEKIGTIKDIVLAQTIDGVLNDGDNYYSNIEKKPETNIPSAYNQYITIDFTDKNFDITQIDQSFITMTVRAHIDTTFGTWKPWDDANIVAGDVGTPDEGKQWVMVDGEKVYIIPTDLDTGMTSFNLNKCMEEFKKGTYYYIALKNASDLLNEYTIYRNGVVVDNTLQNDGTNESWLMHLYDDKAQ